MKQVVLITGANGILAKQLAAKLESRYTVRFLTRKVSHKNEYLWDISKQYIDPKALLNVNHIVHLAGASIADKRWTKDRKELIIASRVDSANLLLSELQKNKITVESFISASAIGYYGTETTETIYEETSPHGDGFLSNVCVQWEQSALEFKRKNSAKRVAIVRIGVVLDQHEGALQKILQPIKLGLGAPVGSGNQYMPWIHIEDLVSAFNYIIENQQLSGIFNAVSPQHLTNREVTKSIAEHIGKPLILPNVPKFAMKLLFGEMAVILLEGSRVSSKKIMDAGFTFKYEKIDAALKNLLT